MSNKNKLSVTGRKVKGCFAQILWKGFAMKKNLTQKPLCEICGKATALFFETTTEDYPEKGQLNHWKFLCLSCGPDHYAIEIRDFFVSLAEEVDWFRHLNEKRWFDMGDFLKMLDRFVAKGAQEGHQSGRQYEKEIYGSGVFIPSDYLE